MEASQMQPNNLDMKIDHTLIATPKKLPTLDKISTT